MNQKRCYLAPFSFINLYVSIVVLYYLNPENQNVMRNILDFESWDIKYYDENSSLMLNISSLTATTKKH